MFSYYEHKLNARILILNLIDIKTVKYYNSFMKKIWKVTKVLLLVLIIAAAIGGTCYFFYSHIRANVNAFNEFSSFIYGGQKDEFDAKLEHVATYTDNRFDLIIDTNDKLEEIAINLNYHLINAKEYELDEHLIVEQLDKVSSEQRVADDMMDEYLIKVNSSSFNRNTGANDLYQQMSRYFVTFSDMLNCINSELNNTNIVKNGDVKFSIIDVYANVCIDTFSDLVTDVSGLRHVTDSNNINIVNQYVNFKNGYIVPSGEGDSFSHLNNNFINNYENCNKSQFASDLAQNVSNIVNITDSSSSLEKAVYYFKGVLGIR